MAIVKLSTTNSQHLDFSQQGGNIDVPLATKYRAALFPSIPAHVFRDEAKQALSCDTEGGFIALDISDILKTRYPATTPALLCRYVVLRAHKPFSHQLNATGEIYYVINGEGRSFNNGHLIAWKTGDVFCLPGGSLTEHKSNVSATLYLCTDEPLLSFLGVSSPKTPPILPVHFRTEDINKRLASIYQNKDEHRAPGKALNFSTKPMAQVMSILPAMTAAINSLEVGGDQKPHRHNAVAVTLGIQTDGIYSLIDGGRLDWEPFTPIITPPGVVHSHHNRGSSEMRSFVVQDGGLHYYCRTGMFEQMES